ncbi:glycosyltransferase family 39 protein [Vibrio sp. ZSDZ65]|uniref:Glycosyltransferase family 39 protein n=1 Tax=Vibrio qingdaonensis TaxID=2829491 RepID=A0A9X3HXS6_9VIBR|nr:glycosyltransferase family 39 protein [Vibrio qingdaonensis]MCW8348050.1 glycosyltransferase family 39 protein [Vibrio qingdaonensis]
MAKGRTLWILLIGALVIRLLTLGLYPLMDTTESRYGEMARLMVETGNWLTPLYDYGVPFWGKPPLFTWMSAVSVELFGLSEFTLRFPHWIAGVLVVIGTAWFAKKNGYNPLVAAVVLSTTLVFSISAGAVMTDMALTLGLAMAMIGFYQCWRGETFMGYIGFIGLAVGLLAKGPVAIVLFGLAVFPWMVIQHGIIGAFVELWRRFPLIKGTLLMLVIALPWYLMAEQATPGFIDYFIVGEHFKRFVEPGWTGDLYGSGHQEPKGKIWFFWVLAVLPWSLILPVLMLVRAKFGLEQAKQNHGFSSFALWWALSPLVLFTVSSNILPTYVLPGTSGVALLIAIFWKKKDMLWLSIAALIVPVALIAATYLLATGKVADNSDKRLIAELDPEVKTFYFRPRSYSGQFYSFGQAKQLKSDDQLVGHNEFYLITYKERAERDFAPYQERYQCSDTVAENFDRVAILCKTPE